MNSKNPQVDDFLSKTSQWRPEYEKLRSIILRYPLVEELKWRFPCYTLEAKNVVLIHGFKEYCAVLFFKGVFIKDAKGVLQSPGRTQAGRQLRFRNLKEITSLEATLKSYVKEAIEVEKAGLKVKLKKTSDCEIPAEFQHRLDKNRALKAAFQGLTSGRQRAYIYYFADAKQSKTCEARIKKCQQRILDGRGLTD